MTLDPNALEKLTRDELIQHARELGAKRPELLTRPELRDEIIRLTVTETDEQRRARGWFGVARDLVASVVGQGLNLPDAADLIRGVHVFSPIPAPPVATVTLAEIYAAQGHLKKALDLLDEVLEKEPDHLAARQARERWAKAAAPSESTGIGTKAEPVASEPPADSVWFDESITQEVPSQPGHDEATANPPDAISAPDATAPAQATPYDVEPSLATATPIEPSPLGLSAAEKANPDNAFTSIETADPREAAPEQGVSSETA
ncbi:MAG TPA: tetratricopeptide repeat protein, partial [Polyangiaceae bacterium]